MAQDEPFEIRPIGENAVLVGFTTYSGTVTTASEWDPPLERKRVRPAFQGSYEALFHAAGVPQMLTELRGNRWLSRVLDPMRLERTIGVIYLPETERMSHYFHAQPPHQFDALILMNHTRAVEPIERTSRWEAGELPETYRFAL